MSTPVLTKPVVYEEQDMLHVSVRRGNGEQIDLALPDAAFSSLLSTLNELSRIQKDDAERHKGLDELVAEAQALGMY